MYNSSLRQFARLSPLFRFAISAGLNFSLSYGSYLLFLSVTSPMIAYIAAFAVGMCTGTVLHIRITHLKRLTAGNIGMQNTIQLIIGFAASSANRWASQVLDPRLSGLALMLVSSLLSFYGSRVLLR